MRVCTESDTDTQRERERERETEEMSERIRRVLTYVRVSPQTRAVTRLKGTDVGRECRLGQSEECEIFIRKEGVTRPVHALLLVRDAARPGATLVNASAGAPTLLNGTPVATEAAVHSGDLVSICQRHFLYEEFVLVPPPGPSESSPSDPGCSDSSSSSADEAERVDATPDGTCAAVGERLAVPLPERSELSVSQPARACVSEPPHVSGRREQLQQALEHQHQQDDKEDGSAAAGGDSGTQRLGFGIDFPVRKDCSLFVAPGDDDASQGAPARPAPATAPLLGSAGDSLEQVAAEPSTPSASASASASAVQPSPPATSAETAETAVVTTTATATTTRPRASGATRAVFAGVCVVVGPCADVARVVSSVMECGGRVGTLAAHAACAPPWTAQPPRTFFVARAAPARSGAALGAAGVLCLVRRVPVVDEQWVADCHRARTRLAFEPYLLRVAVPGASPATCATQPLATADTLEEAPLLVVPERSDRAETHRARFRLVACDGDGLVRRDDAARRALQPVESLVRVCGGTLAMETRHTYDATLVAVVDEPPAPAAPQRKRARVDHDSAPPDGRPAPPLLRVDWLLACVLRGALVPTTGFVFDPDAPIAPAPAPAAARSQESPAKTPAPARVATTVSPERGSPAARKKRHGGLLDGMEVILDAGVGSAAHVQRVVETHGGRVVRTLPRSPESQHAHWAQPRLVFLTERARVAGLCGIVALCLARAVPVARLAWLTDSVRARTRLALAPYLLPVDSARCARPLAQPIPFACADPAGDGLFAAAPSRFVQLRVVGRDGHELATTATKSLLVCRTHYPPFSVFLCLCAHLCVCVCGAAEEHRVARGHHGRRHRAGHAPPLPRQRVHHRQQPRRRGPPRVLLARQRRRRRPGRHRPVALRESALQHAPPPL